MECFLEVLKIAAWLSFIFLCYQAVDYIFKLKKEGLGKIKELEKSIKFLNDYCGKNISDIKAKGELLTVRNAKIRDFFIRTNYTGRLTDKKLIQDFKDSLDVPFDDFKSCVLNYKTEKLEEYYKTYKECEAKQMILDTYSDKHKEAK